jgi:putative proteasome-type protease
MTYCLSINVNQGLVLCSDSRTNAGMDNISTYSKLHSFVWPGQRSLFLMCAGNLATTQSVIKKLRSDIKDKLAPNLLLLRNMQEVADYIGYTNSQVQFAQRQRDTANTNFEATFLVAGQIGTARSETILVYPQGNYIHESADHPFLQIGEIKYGKPILDRVIKRDTDLEPAARCALVSMNSTIRSNVTVGPPIDLLIYTANCLNEGRRLQLTEDDPFARELSDRWSKGLTMALENLPRFPWETANEELPLAQGQIYSFIPPNN